MSKSPHSHPSTHPSISHTSQVLTRPLLPPHPPGRKAHTPELLLGRTPNGNLSTESFMMQEEKASMQPTTRLSPTHTPAQSPTLVSPAISPQATSTMPAGIPLIYSLETNLEQKIMGCNRFSLDMTEHHSKAELEQHIMKTPITVGGARFLPQVPIPDSNKHHQDLCL